MIYVCKFFFVTIIYVLHKNRYLCCILPLTVHTKKYAATIQRPPVVGCHAPKTILPLVVRTSDLKKTIN